MKALFLMTVVLLMSSFAIGAKPEPTAEIAFLTFPNDPEHSEIVRLGFKALKKPEKSGTSIKHWRTLHPRIMGRSKNLQHHFGATPKTRERKEWIVFDQQTKLGKLSSWTTGRIDRTRSIFYYLNSHDVAGIVGSSLKLENTNNIYHTSLGPDKHKPILLLNRTEFKDPENWSLSNKKDCADEAIRSFYRGLKNYTFIEDKTKKIFRQPPFVRSDVKVIACYINNKNKKLVGLKVPGFTFESNVGGNLVYNKWYSNFQFQEIMDSYSFNAMPVAFGDFNNNGSTEWLFQTKNSHNIGKDGYMLRDNKDSHVYFISWPMRK